MKRRLHGILMVTFVTGFLLSVASDTRAQVVAATGGDQTNDYLNYRIHVFTNTAVTHTFHVTTGGSVEVLVVGGGGGGGGDLQASGGGGGVVFGTVTVTNGQLVDVTVGAGGAGGVNQAQGRRGENSVFETITAYGGGGRFDDDGDGASGSGSSGRVDNPGSAIDYDPYQGHNGGTRTGTKNYGGGGGGGAGGLGGDGVDDNGGAGGIGTNYSHFVGPLPLGDDGWFGGGGGGCSYQGTRGAGGKGGGGKGGGGYAVQAENGLPNTGGGGGGGAWEAHGSPTRDGGSGGSGIVIVRYSVGAVPLSVSDDGVTELGKEGATLNGTVVGTGGEENPLVYVCWGASDPQTDSTGAWANVVSKGADWDEGQSFSHELTGLQSGETYHYRFFVTNSTGGAWSGTGDFRTRGLFFHATGGNVTNEYGIYRVHTFTNPGPHTLEVIDGGTVEVLVVGGGGGGGGDLTASGGGGGVVFDTLTIEGGQSVIVTVGAGGTGSAIGNAGLPGSNSVFGTITAYGGGGRGLNSGDGASGSGSSGRTDNQGSAIDYAPYQGHNGGVRTGNYGGGGGGGAGGVGGGAGTAIDVGGDGGIGLDYSHFVGDLPFGDEGWFGGGGGGCSYTIGSGSIGTGGKGGGGDGGSRSVTAENGDPNTGGGGGGGGHTDGGASSVGGSGGSGIVIVRYKIQSAPLSVSDDGVTGQGTQVATLHGTVTGTGGAEEPLVYVCWGASDPQTESTGAWANVVFRGEDWGEDDSFSHELTGLTSGQTYHYRFFVTNSTGGAWSGTGNFRTLGKFVHATGGNVTNEYEIYRVHTFTNPGLHTLEIFDAGTAGGMIEVLVVGGGGGGSRDLESSGGGGGVVFATVTVTNGQLVNVTVGDGGAGGAANPAPAYGSRGGISVFGDITAYGGGGFADDSGDGASGSGSSGRADNPGSAINYDPYQGYNGGTRTGNYGGGGGGGAGGPGNAGNGDNGGNGGIGTNYSHFVGSLPFGDEGWFGGGGGGCSFGDTAGNGGKGGGGKGGQGSSAGTRIKAENGLPNTGGGGGGGAWSGVADFDGGSGGSGIVIVRYAYTETIRASVFRLR